MLSRNIPWMNSVLGCWGFWFAPISPTIINHTSWSTFTFPALRVCNLPIASVCSSGQKSVINNRDLKLIQEIKSNLFETRNVHALIVGFRIPKLLACSQISELILGKSFFWDVTMHISLNDVLFSKIYCAELCLMHAHLMCLPLYARLVCITEYCS